MIVKRCGKEDIDKIYEIEEQSFSDPLKRETILKDLGRNNFYCYGLYDEDIKAFISYEKVLDEAQIISVAVSPCDRRKGYGKELLEKVCAEAKKEGIAFFTLEVRSNNLPAIALYEKAGFNRVGLRKNYYQNPLCDAVLMDLKIGED